MNEKKNMIVLGSSSNDRKSCRDNANNGYRKAYRACPPYTATRITAECVEQSTRPPTYNI